LVGGGGIAMELARHPVLQHCDVVWVRATPPPPPQPLPPPNAQSPPNLIAGSQVVKDDIVGKHYLDDVAARCKIS
jgi:hypothetical protein